VKGLKHKAETSAADARQFPIRQSADVASARRIAPEVGRRMQPSIDSRVDFPEPEGPIINAISPGRTEKDTESTRRRRLILVVMFGEARALRAWAHASS